MSKLIEMLRIETCSIGYLIRQKSEWIGLDWKGKEWTGLERNGLKRIDSKGIGLNFIVKDLIEII